MIHGHAPAAGLGPEPLGSRRAKLPVAATRDPARGSRRARLRSGLARGGLEYVLTAGVSYLPNRWMIYTHHVLLRCDGRALGLTDAARAGVRLGTPEDAERLARPGDLVRDAVDQRFRDGDTCVVVDEDGRILASAWAATGTRYLTALGQTLCVPPDAFYVHDTFTDPAARRRGLATLCYRRLFGLFAEQGRTTAYAAVEVLNQASLAAHARWGFVPVGRARKLGILWFRGTYRPRWPGPGQRFRLFTASNRPPHRVA